MRVPTLSLCWGPGGGSWDLALWIPGTPPRPPWCSQPLPPPRPRLPMELRRALGETDVAH